MFDVKSGLRNESDCDLLYMYIYIYIWLNEFPPFPKLYMYTSCMHCVYVTAKARLIFAYLYSYKQLLQHFHGNTIFIDF